ncbi:MAG: LCP family protein [Armatimonadota bacterium]|nr:LCP family protein [Armatimonadota bacterium]
MTDQHRPAARRAALAALIVIAALSAVPLPAPEPGGEPAPEPDLAGTWLEGMLRPGAGQAPQPPAAPATPSESPRRHLLLIGVDDVAGSRRADALVLASITLDPPRIALISIPRDLRVQLAGRGWDKINAAYAYGGAALVVRTVEALLDLTVDWYAVINYQAFGRIVDQLGGLDYTIERRMYYVDRAAGLVIDLQPGPQHLDGDRALQYVRYRGDGRGDLGRIARHQQLLRVALNQWRTPRTLARLPRVLPDLMRLVQTNLSVAEILRLAGVLSVVPADDVRTLVVWGRPAVIQGVYYAVGEPERIRRDVTVFLNEALP